MNLDWNLDILLNKSSEIIGGREHCLWSHLGAHVTKLYMIKKYIPNQPDVFLDPT